MEALIFYIDLTDLHIQQLHHARLAHRLEVVVEAEVIHQAIEVAVAEAMAVAEDEDSKNAKIHIKECI